VDAWRAFVQVADPSTPLVFVTCRPSDPSLTGELLSRCYPVPRFTTASAARRGAADQVSGVEGARSCATCREPPPTPRDPIGRPSILIKRRMQSLTTLAANYAQQIVSTSEELSQE